MGQPPPPPPPLPRKKRPGSPSGLQKRGRRFSLLRGARLGGRGEGRNDVSTRSLEISYLDDTVEEEEAVSVPCFALGRPACDGSCRLFTRFGGVNTTVIRLAEADAMRLLQLGKVRIGWVECRVREHVEIARCFRCLGYSHRSRGCGNHDRKNACWGRGITGKLARCCKAPPRCLMCLNRGDKDIAHVSGGVSYPVILPSVTAGAFSSA